MDINLSTFTELELLDLRFRVNEELAEVKNRNKVKVYKVFKEFDGTKYFYKRDSAISELNDMIKYGEVFNENDNRIELKVGYLTEAEASKFCEDKLD